MLVLLHGAGGVMKMPRLLGLVGTLPHFGNAQADAAVVDRDAMAADQHHFPAATERAAVRQLRTGTPIVSISRKLCLIRSRPAQTPIASWGVDWQAQALMVTPAVSSKPTGGLYPPPQAVLVNMVTQAKRQHGNTATRQHETRW